MKIYHFRGIFWCWDWGPITPWIDEILPAHLYIVCFITLLDIFKANFDKKLGFNHLLGQNPNFCQFFFHGSPNSLAKTHFKCASAFTLFSLQIWECCKSRFFGANFWAKIAVGFTFFAFGKYVTYTHAKCRINLFGQNCCWFYIFCFWQICDKHSW